MGHGLMNIQSRVSGRWMGRFRYESEVGGGTLVSVRVVVCKTTTIFRAELGQKNAVTFVK